MEHIDNLLRGLERYIKPQGIKILSVLGFLYFTAKSIQTISSLGRLIFRFGHNLSDRYGEGSWAVITGGGQDVGTGFALELAQKGFNIVLIDSNRISMERTLAMIDQRFPNVEVKIIEANFSNCLQEGFFDSILNQISDLDISILVNALGTSQPIGFFHWAMEHQIINALILNTFPVTLLSRRLIPGMLRRPKKSAVINISSVAGTYPTTMIGMYSSTKAYVDFLSRIIDEEVGSKVDVISVRPWIVSSVISKSSLLNIFNADPQNLAKSVLRRLGTRSYSYGSLGQEIQASLGTTNIFRRFFFKRLYEMEQKSNINLAENIL